MVSTGAALTVFPVWYIELLGMLIGFANLLRTFHAEVAQSVEQRTENPCVAGSIPALGKLFSVTLIGE